MIVNRAFDLDFHCPACNMVWLVSCRVDDGDRYPSPCYAPETKCPLCGEAGEMGRRRIKKE